MIEFRVVPDIPNLRTPWTLVAACALLLVLVLYLLLGAYLPTRRHAVRLESELHDLQARAAEIQVRISQQQQQHALREQQVIALTAERDALGKRVEELENEIAKRRKR